MSEKKKPWRTAISNYDEGTITIGGYRVKDMMRHLDFGGAMFVLCQQRVPSAAEAKLLNALMISVLDHGIVAPSAIARIIAASGVPLQACAAAGTSSQVRAAERNASKGMGIRCIQKATSALTQW